MHSLSIVAVTTELGLGVMGQDLRLGWQARNKKIQESKYVVDYR